MTLLQVLNAITWAISIGAAIYFVYLVVPLVKAAYVAAKAEAEEAARLKKAADLLEAIGHDDEEQAA